MENLDALSLDAISIVESLAYYKHNINIDIVLNNCWHICNYHKSFSMSTVDWLKALGKKKSFVRTKENYSNGKKFDEYWHGRAWLHDNNIDHIENIDSYEWCQYVVIDLFPNQMLSSN